MLAFITSCNVDAEASPPEVPSAVDAGRPFVVNPPRPFGGPAWPLKEGPPRDTRGTSPPRPRFGLDIIATGGWCWLCGSQHCM